MGVDMNSMFAGVPSEKLAIVAFLTFAFLGFFPSLAIANWWVDGLERNMSFSVIFFICLGMLICGGFGWGWVKIYVAFSSEPNLKPEPEPGLEAQE